MTDSQFLLALDRHRMTLMASIIGVIALLVIASALNLARKPSVQNNTAAQTIGLVQELIRQGKSAEALELLNENEGDVEKGVLWSTRAGIYYRLGNYADAEREYRTMIAQDLNLPTASINLALALFKQGRYEEAIEMYDRCQEQFATAQPAISERAKDASRFIRLYRETLVPQK